MAKYVAVGGTWAWSGGKPKPTDWYSSESEFAAFLRARGHEHMAPSRPFIWTTELTGVLSWRFWQSPKLTTWEAGGHALYAYCDSPGCSHDDGQDICVITHSHGLQVALYAAALGLRIRTLIDVSGPVREDMHAIALDARKNIGNWLHIHSDSSDKIQVGGGLFDGHVGVERKVRIPGVINAEWPGVGHSRLLNEPALFPIWEEQLWLNYLDLQWPPLSASPKMEM